MRSFFTINQGRAERAARDGALTSHELERRGGRCDAGGRVRRDGRKAPAGFSLHLGWQLRLSALRRTAGCRPSATPGTACHRLAAVTPADPRPRGDRPSSRRSSLEPTKITVKSAPAFSLRVACDSLRSLLTAIFSAHDRAYRKDGQDQAAEGKCSRAALHPGRLQRIYASLRLTTTNVTAIRAAARATKIPVSMNWNGQNR